MTLTEAKRLYREWQHKPTTAFAMGHGCSMGGANPVLTAIREEGDKLLAQVRLCQMAEGLMPEAGKVVRYEWSRN